MPSRVPTELSLGHENLGLRLQVTAAGHKSFVIQYRAKGRSRRMAIDGVLSLENARKRARALLGEVAHDRDPLQESVGRRRERDAFQAVAENYLAREGKKLRSTEERQRTLERLVYPVMGARRLQTSGAATSCGCSITSRTTAAR